MSQMKDVKFLYFQNINDLINFKLQIYVNIARSVTDNIGDFSGKFFSCNIF